MERVHETIDSFMSRHTESIFDGRIRSYVLALLMAQLRLYTDALAAGVFLGDGHAANVGVVASEATWIEGSAVHVKIIDLEQVSGHLYPSDIIVEYGDLLPKDGCVHRWLVFPGSRGWVCNSFSHSAHEQLLDSCCGESCVSTHLHMPVSIWSGVVSRQSGNHCGRALHVVLQSPWAGWSDTPIHHFPHGSLI